MSTERRVQTREPCDLLSWDSEFFGLRIARVRLHRLGPSEVSKVATWCKNRRVDCAYFLASGSDASTSRRAQDAGYRMVGIRASFSADLRSLPRYCAAEGVRLHDPADVEPMSTLSRGAFKGSRFYRDDHFPRRRCDALYETWLRKSCAGWAQAVFLIGRQGRPDGFVTCHLDPGMAGRIGLIAVEPRSRGSGVGSRLIQAALYWFGKKGVNSVSVVTEGGNVRAIRLYEHSGFRADSLDVWYHFWPRRRT